MTNFVTNLIEVRLQGKFFPGFTKIKGIYFSAFIKSSDNCTRRVVWLLIVTDESM